MRISVLQGRRRARRSVDQRFAIERRRRGGGRRGGQRRGGRGRQRRGAVAGVRRNSRTGRHVAGERDGTKPEPVDQQQQQRRLGGPATATAARSRATRTRRECLMDHGGRIRLVASVLHRCDLGVAPCPLPLSTSTRRRPRNYIYFYSIKCFIIILYY